MRSLYLVALLAASCLVSSSLAIECTFSWETVAADNVRAVAQGTIEGGSETCGSSVLTGTPPQLAGQSIDQCGWPSGAVTGYVTFSGATDFDGTYNLTNGEEGDYFMDVQCNLGTGYPYTMSEQGIDFGVILSSTQTRFFKLRANQTYVRDISGDAYAPYSNVINGYDDTLINGEGNFTLCCPNFATSDSCYGPNTTPPTHCRSVAHPHMQRHRIVILINRPARRRRQQQQHWWH